MDITLSFVHRLTAYVLGMDCYRNTDLVEQKHQAGTPTDNEFYQAVLPSFSASLNAYISDIAAIQKLGGIWDVLAKGPEPPNKFYHSYLAYYEECRKGNRWDAPVMLDGPIDLPPAEYILAGAFKNTCDDEQTLTQERMSVINHDIHNRIYTLIEKGIIPLPLKSEGKRS